MDTIKTGKLALSYAGIFLGAGFISGQELWQFFACFSSFGLPGFLLTLTIFFPIYYCLLRLVHDTGEERIGRLLTLGDHPRLRLAVDLMQNLFIFGIIVIMTAGICALGRQMLDLPEPLVGAVFTGLLILVALTGLQGMVATFSLLVPVTTVCTLLLAVATLSQQGFRLEAAVGSVSPLLPNWPVSAVTYAAYNIFATIGILIPLAGMLPDRRTIRRGLGLGSALLFLLAGSSITAMAALPSAGLTELPMMTLAQQLHPLLALPYGLLMALGMFAAALGSLTALLVQLGLRWPAATQKRAHFTVFISLTAFLGGLLGFGNLVGIVYPLFGYASIPLLICLLLNYRRHRSGSLAWTKEEEHSL